MLVILKDDPYLGINMVLEEPVVVRENLRVQRLSLHTVTS
jgi:hypothetical protein